MDRLNTRVILRHDGQAKWLAPVILKSKCPINVKYFPFDEQRCKMKFGSWTYDKSRLNLIQEDESADLSKFPRARTDFLAYFKVISLHHMILDGLRHIISLTNYFIHQLT